MRALIPLTPLPVLLSSHIIYCRYVPLNEKDIFPAKDIGHLIRDASIVFE
jgi:hypothetical protein